MAFLSDLPPARRFSKAAASAHHDRSRGRSCEARGGLEIYSGVDCGMRSGRGDTGLSWDRKSSDSLRELGFQPLGRERYYLRSHGRAGWIESEAAIVHINVGVRIYGHRQLKSLAKIPAEMV
jgi:hypothetical protein